MRYLILSDIHGNGDALRAVVSHAKGTYDRILCCGDIVGYGAEPNEVTAWVREHSAATVRGNHDKACTGSADLEWFNPAARTSALWTMSVLTDDHADYLRQLPVGPLGVDGFQLLHGSPVDEDEYLVTPQDAAEVVPYLDRPVSFFGHTHLQGGFQCHRRSVKRLPPVAVTETDAVLELDPDSFYLINPGSVGQPRDHDSRAAYLLYFPEDGLVAYQRVEYDVRAAQARIREAGLPEVLAMRLAVGQ